MTARYGQHTSIQWPMRDWSYRAARRRLFRVGQQHLPAHTATTELDSAGNFIVQCACSWRGNGVGWLGHLHDVVDAAISE